MAIAPIRLDPFRATAQNFTRWFRFADNDEQNYALQVAKLAGRDRVKVYLAKDTEAIYGFVALSASVVGKWPCVVIDYMFASAPFRGSEVPALSGLKLGEFFIGHAINVTKEIGNYVPMRHIALQPASDALADYYRRYDFEFVDKEKRWMFIKVS